MGVFDFEPDASAIEEALQDLDISNLSVSVDGGEVTISGTAASESVRNKALAIAGKIDGVETVVDDLYIADEDEGDDGEYEESDDTYEEDDEGNKVHKVVAGDTLWGLAEKYYGDGSRYMEIFNANKAVWKNYNNDPNVIHIGWKLIIP
jgi:nucleoid-associated protein YgaU